jgi:hypothetical protein
MECTSSNPYTAARWAYWQNLHVLSSFERKDGLIGGRCRLKARTWPSGSRAFEVARLAAAAYDLRTSADADAKGSPAHRRRRAAGPWPRRTVVPSIAARSASLPE